MKKTVALVLIALVALISIPAKAQVKFGIKGGLNISTVHFSEEILSKGNMTGFQVGPMIEARIPLVGVGFDAAVLYSQKGMGIGSEDIKTDYLDIPVNLKWKFGLPVVKGFLTAGPYVGFRVGGDKIWKVLNDQIEAKSFSAGLNFGAGIELISHVQVGVNYGLGLTDNYSIKKVDLTDGGSGKNRGWSITAAILF